jgi:hypothetical protein
MKLLQTFIVVLATVLELQDKRYYIQVWRAFRKLGISRYELVAGISAMIEEGKLIILSTGDYFVMPDLEKIWPMWSDRCFSYYLEAEASGKLPKRYCTRRMQRLMTIDLYLRYYHPEISRAIIMNMNPEYKDFIKKQ